MTTLPNQTELLELPAPSGWSAFLLKQQLPIEDADDLLRYRQAVTTLMERIPAFLEPHPEEVLLLFERLRPGKEINAMKGNARLWMPEFGVGIWLDREPPTTWTAEEFLDAAPGTLRTVIERVVRVQREPVAQASAWRLLLGSGALLRVSAETAGDFVTGATGMLQPTISDSSLTSFPFYVPLLGAESLINMSPAYDQPLGEHLPAVSAYVRESVEDGGMLFVVRQTPEAIWKNLLHAPLDMNVVRITLDE